MDRRSETGRVEFSRRLHALDPRKLEKHHSNRATSLRSPMGCGQLECYAGRFTTALVENVTPSDGNGIAASLRFAAARSGEFRSCPLSAELQA